MINFPHYYLYGASLVVLSTVAQPTIVIGYESTQINDIANNITVRIDINGGQDQGSGVIIAREDSTYYVLTSDHVVKYLKYGDDYQYEIVTPDGESYLVNYDSFQSIADVDLAVVAFESDRSYKVAQMESSADRIRQGATMYVNGFPQAGREIKDGPQFTSGIITGINEGHYCGYNLVYNNVTQKGMSGGPILNAQAKLIGIHGLAEQEKLPEDQEQNRCKNAEPNNSNSSAKREKIDFNLGISIDTFLKHVDNIGLGEILDVSSPGRPVRPNIYIPDSNSSSGCSGLHC